MTLEALMAETAAETQTTASKTEQWLMTLFGFKNSCLTPGL